MRQLSSWLLLALAALWLLAVARFERWPPYPLLMLGKTWLTVGACVLIAAAWLVRWLPTRVGLLLVSATYAFHAAWHAWAPAHGWLSNFREHPRYGHVGTPGAHNYHWSHPEFFAAYRFDDAGWRLSPPPRGEARGDVLFLGCSYTFGIGVGDDEVFPAVLARQYWPHYRVRNQSFPGWGTTEAWLVLEEALAESRLPVAVIYGWIDSHQRRNWLRQSWHRNKIPWRGKVQHFELEQGQLVWHGLLPATAATAEDSPATTAIEMPLTLALLHRMHDACAARGLPFYIVAMNQHYLDRSEVIPQARAEGLAVIDATGVREGFFRVDTHPIPRWHVDIAAVIADDPRLRSFREP